MRVEVKVSKGLVSEDCHRVRESRLKGGGEGRSGGEFGGGACVALRPPPPTSSGLGIWGGVAA